MATLNVYLPDALKAEMDHVKGVNWSQVAQEAIRGAVARSKPMDNIEAVAERLKNTGGARARGFEAGVEWAKSTADAAELEVLEGWDWEKEIANSRSEDPEAVATDLFVSEFQYGDVRDLMGGRVTESRLRGFVEGALSVWNQAKPLL